MGPVIGDEIAIPSPLLTRQCPSTVHATLSNISFYNFSEPHEMTVGADCGTIHHAVLKPEYRLANAQIKGQLRTILVPLTVRARPLKTLTKQPEIKVSASSETHPVTIDTPSCTSEGTYGKSTTQTSGYILSIPRDGTSVLLTPTVPFSGTNQLVQTPIAPEQHRYWVSLLTEKVHSSSHGSPSTDITSGVPSSDPSVTDDTQSLYRLGQSSMAMIPPEMDKGVPKKKKIVIPRLLLT